MRRAPLLLFLALLAAAPARAADVPLAADAFAAYIRDKIQLYSPAPVRVLPPFAIAIGKPGEANLVFDVTALHADCVRDPPGCDARTYDFVQGVVARFASGSAPAGGEAVPGDRAGFMAWLARELGRRLPEDRVAADGMALLVTRPGGKPVRFDQRAYYQQCGQVAFACATALRLSLDRTASWLAPADPARLRIAPHAIEGCAPADCDTAPSDEAMAPVVQHAFANLEAACFKDGAKGLGPLTNADRIDLGLDNAAAIARCAQATRPLLAPLAPPVAGSVTAVEAPYAAAGILMPEAWRALPPGLLAAVPARDTLLYVQGPADRAALAARARAAFAAAGALAIAADIYRWTGTHWEWAAP